MVKKGMAIEPKILELINSSRAPLPPISNLDEPLEIDSVAIIQLTVLLEKEWGIEIKDEELVIENFSTLPSLNDFIESKSDFSEAAPELDRQRTRRPIVSAADLE